ncbi:MAG: hypothetical protein M3O31_14710 [Acidobacteriota bacterium]|nr:hypothetical protein [Acidobacteriota bacterium]
MNHHPAFSTHIPNQAIVKSVGHQKVCLSVIHGGAESAPATKNKGLLHETAFLAERGCLGTVSHPGHPGPAHRH